MDRFIVLGNALMGCPYKMPLEPLTAVGFMLFKTVLVVFGANGSGVSEQYCLLAYEA